MSAPVVVRHPGLVLIVVPCLVLTALGLAGLRAPASTPPGAAAETRAEGMALIPQNRRAPNFSLPLLSGSGQASARALHGRVAVLTFWASWCAACRSETDDLRRLSASYRPRGVRFLGVDHRDDRGPARAFIRAYDPGYPSVFDPKGDLLAAYRAVGLPSTFVIDRHGLIRYMSIGTFDVAAMRRGLDRILAGHPEPADPSGGHVQLSALGGTLAADFTLEDQFARRTSLSDFTGQVVVLAFVDSNCEEVCTLTAEALQKTVDRLGGSSSRVQLLAVNVNARHHRVRDVRAWSREQGMLHRWRFLTGSAPVLRRVWQDYAVEATFRDGELVHDPGLYVIDQQRRERRFLWVSDQRAGVDGEADALADAVRDLLRRA